MEKYLGNKRSLLPSIHDVIRKQCPDVESICDIFSGTTNVSRYFSARGYSIISNDINRFSFLLARCYTGLSKVPQFSGLSLPQVSSDSLNDLQRYYQKAVQRDAQTLFRQEAEAFWTANRPLLQVLHYLNTCPLPQPQNPSFIFDYYCTEGAHSTFTSNRGGTGQRNYFSTPTAQRIDFILNHIRSWHQSSQINAEETAVLMTSLLEEITLTANVNGTFHDFNRARLWPNALQTFSLKLPLYSLAKFPSKIYCEDALKAAPLLPSHDLLYLDPPYNFRQYTAYYHLLNFIAAFPFLDAVEPYLQNLNFVRGQNPLDDFDSDFCHRKRFIPALRKLIEECPGRYVIMSYYGGRNHWNHWSTKTENTDEGFQLICEVFGDPELFRNFEALPLFEERLNYQSRGGEKKRMVNEYLFFGEKAGVSKNKDLQGDLWAKHNRELGLQYFAK